MENTLAFKKRCKIVATLGPASCDPETIEALILKGMNVARLNFSHGTHEFHAEQIFAIRAVSKKLGVSVSILGDLQGPKIRCAKLMGGKMTLEKGETYELTYGLEQKDPKVIPIDYKDLYFDVEKSQRVLMDDGLLILEVIDKTSSYVKVKVLEGGVLKNRKGVNFPDSQLSLPAMTSKDSEDLLFAISKRVDYVALSFVQKASDVEQIKHMIKALGSDMPVISKIEKISAVENIDKIAELSDGLMVARGDLGVEASVEKVPAYQQHIIDAAAKHTIPVIIATQMLESMVSEPRASVAEITDVANGVLDGADAVMLSAEVASGKYPVESVNQMKEIITQVENWRIGSKVRYYVNNQNHGHFEDKTWPDAEAIAKTACETADSLQAAGIVCLTLTGTIARTISKWRPKHSP